MMDLAQFRATVAQGVPPEGHQPGAADAVVGREGRLEPRPCLRAAGRRRRPAPPCTPTCIARKATCGNAGGWYSRAGREPATVSLDEEWQSLAEEMLTAQAIEGARAAMDGFMAAFNAQRRRGDPHALVPLPACALPQRARHGHADAGRLPEPRLGQPRPIRGMDAVGLGLCRSDRCRPGEGAFPRPVHPLSRRRERHRQLPVAVYRDVQGGALGNPGPLELGRMTGRV